VNDPIALPNLTVQQLEYLDAVSASATWAQAAAMVGVSPSALSQGLAELERRLGVTLFERQGRRQVPTAEAAVVLDHARLVVAQTRDLARWAATTRSGRSGRLRLGMIDAVAVDRYPDVLREFRRARPDLELHLAVAPSGELLDQLRRGALDLAVCVASPDLGRDLDVVALIDEPLTVYMPNSGRPGPPATWGPWVTFPEGSHTRALIQARVRELGAAFDVVAESHQPEVLREMVRLGLGWTVLPMAQAERLPAPLRRGRKAPILSRPLVAVRRHSAPPHPAAEALLAALLAAS